MTAPLGLSAEAVTGQAFYLPIREWLTAAGSGDINQISAVGKTEQKETKLEIGLPQGGFPKTMFFNRFRIDRDADFSLVQFGLVVAADLVDGCSCLLPSETLQQNKQTLLDYLNRIGRAEKSSDISWKGLSGERRADVADVITMAFRGEMAETCLFVFSWTAATRAKKTSATSEAIIAQPLVLLRSSAELQKQLIEALYAE